MRSWINQHRLTLAQVLRRWARTPFTVILAITVVGIALSLPAGLYLLLQDLESAMAGMEGSEPEISLFLAVDSPPASAEQIKQKLGSLAEIKSFRYVSRAEAWSKMKDSPEMGGVAASLTRNPLPDAFIVKPKGHDPKIVDTLQAEFQKWPGVDYVQADSAWAKRLNALLALGKQAVAVLAVLLGIALAAVTANMVRTQILTQKDEIEVSKLIGATDTFIRRPFLYQGLLQGLLGGAAAWIIVSAGLWLLQGNVADLARLYGSNFRLLGFSLTDSLVLLAGSSALGWLGAHIAVSRHLRRIEPR